jgi:ribosome-associated protein
VDPRKLSEEIAKIISFSFSRSQGKGGQNVNKVNTKVTARISIDDCVFLDKNQRSRISARLSSRINQDGELVIHVQDERSQFANREKAIERFVALITGALVRKKKRIKTKPSVSQIERRIKAKKAVSEKKKSRRRDDIV